MLVIQHSGLIAALIVGVAFVLPLPRRTSVPTGRSRPRHMRQMAAERLTTHSGDVWFRAATRLVWGLMIASLSLFAVLIMLD